jgi:hypothetical protein
MRTAEPPMSKTEVEEKWRGMFYFDENAAIQYILSGSDVITPTFIVRGAKETVVLPATVGKEEKDSFLNAVRIAAIAYSARSVTTLAVGSMLKSDEEMSQEEAARRMAAADPAELIAVLSVSIEWQDRGYKGSFHHVRPIIRDSDGVVTSVGEIMPYPQEEIAGDSTIRLLPQRYHSAAERKRAKRMLTDLGGKVSMPHFIHKAGHA